MFIYYSRRGQSYQGHETLQEQSLKERFKSNFQTKNKIRLCDS
jgi:hypothetical protein